MSAMSRTARAGQASGSRSLANMLALSVVLIGLRVVSFAFVASPGLHSRGSGASARGRVARNFFVKVQDVESVSKPAKVEKKRLFVKVDEKTKKKSQSVGKKPVFVKVDEKTPNKSQAKFAKVVDSSEKDRTIAMLTGLVEALTAKFDKLAAPAVGKKGSESQAKSAKSAESSDRAIAILMGEVKVLTANVEKLAVMVPKLTGAQVQKEVIKKEKAVQKEVIKKEKAVQKEVIKKEKTKPEQSTLTVDLKPGSGSPDARLFYMLKGKPSKDEMMKAFQEAGDVASVEMWLQSGTDKVLDMGVVVYVDPAEAESAMNKLKELDFVKKVEIKN